MLKQTSADDVCRAVREVHKGKMFFSPSVARRIARLNPPSAGNMTTVSKKISLLTSREMEVLQLIAEHLDTQA